MARSKRMRWVVQRRGMHIDFGGKVRRKETAKRIRSRSRWVYNNKMDFGEIG
jgi:hypothetical protein